MSDREELAEVVRSGQWLYGGEVPTEVWIIRQNFEFHYDEGFENGPEDLNADGEVFQIVFVRVERVTVNAARHTLAEAIETAERLVPQGIRWTNHFLGKLFDGRRYSVRP